MALAHAGNSGGSCALAYGLVWIQTVSQSLRPFHRHLWLHCRRDYTSLLALSVVYRHSDWRRSELGNRKAIGKETPKRVSAHPLDGAARNDGDDDDERTRGQPPRCSRAYPVLDLAMSTS